MIIRKRTLKYKSSRTKSNRTKSNRTKSNRTKSKQNGINILSYNISWESMSGAVKNWSLCNNNTNKTNTKHFSVCVNNISNVFDSSDTLDFITLQEATDYKKLIKESSRLKTMKYEIHKSGLDTIITFWENKYKLQDKIVGEFENGRPWMATIFNGGICLINVHMGHYYRKEEFEMMDNMFLDIKDKLKNKLKENNKEKLRYIISGDFNYDIKDFGGSRNYFKLDNTNFYFNRKHILTCCINRKKHNDHVIDSLESPIDIIIPKVKYMASDHKPILVKLI
jgi:endonuclease/exonuclease/phosphatase family metal-dependent hydrolase